METDVFDQLPLRVQNAAFDLINTLGFPETCSVDDLLQAAALADLEAAGTSLSNRQQACRKAVRNEELKDLIAVPPTKTLNIPKLEAAQEQLQQEGTDTCDVKALSALTGLGQPTVEKLLCAQAVLPIVSLDQTVITDDGVPTELGEFLPLTDAKQPDFEQYALNQLGIKLINQALARLSEREKEVLAMRFGFAGEETFTLDEIGQALGVGRQTVWQTEDRALRKVRGMLKITGIDRDWF